MFKNLLTAFALASISTLTAGSTDLQQESEPLSYQGVVYNSQQDFADNLYFHLLEMKKFFEEGKVKNNS